MTNERLKAHLRAAVLGLRDMRVDAAEDLLADLTDDMSDDEAHRELNEAIIEGIRWARRAASTTVIRGGAMLQYIGPRGERITHEWGRAGKPVDDTIREVWRVVMGKRERSQAENERLRALVHGALAAIDTGRNEPLMAWRDHARAALNGEGET